MKGEGGRGMKRRLRLRTAAAHANYATCLHAQNPLRWAFPLDGFLQYYRTKGVFADVLCTLCGCVSVAGTVGRSGEGRRPALPIAQGRPLGYLRR